MSESEFLENTEKQDAVIRNLEIIGEAARNLPAEFKQRHSHVQWAPIAGMRDRLIHQYFVHAAVRAVAKSFHRRLRDRTKSIVDDRANGLRLGALAVSFDS
jgi:uncharacterized protein with HEPN domain